MHTRDRLILFPAALLFIGLVGCGPQDAAPPQQAAAPSPPAATVEGEEAPVEAAEPAAEEPVPADPQQMLLDHWMTMAETPEAYFDVKDPIRLGIELSDTGPNALDPLFAILADPDAGPAKKRLVVVTVEQIMKRDMVPKLLPLVADTYDGTTRACAVHLLANAGDAELEPTFVELRSDSDPRVKLAALRGLAALGSEEGRTALTEIYNDAEAPPAHRELAVIDLAAHFAPESMDLMRDVLRKGELTEATQRSAAEAIGRHGVPEDIPLMREVEARATVRSDLLLWTLFAIKNLEELSTADTPDDAVASEAAE